MKLPSSPQAMVLSALVVILVMRIASIFLWPLFGGLVVLLALIGIYKLILKDRFY